MVFSHQIELFQDSLLSAQPSKCTEAMPRAGERGTATTRGGARAIASDEPTLGFLEVHPRSLFQHEDSQVFAAIPMATGRSLSLRQPSVRAIAPDLTKPGRKSFAGAESVGGWAVSAPSKQLDGGMQRTTLSAVEEEQLSRIGLGGYQSSPIAYAAPSICTKPSLDSRTSERLGEKPRRRGGRRRALLIGINYAKTKGARPLRGCVNDTLFVYDMLEKEFAFSAADCWIMTDEMIELPPGARHFHPNRASILNGMRWLVHGANTGDELFFHFSGHGGQVRDRNGDELDGWDETILPSDYPSSGPIIDDEIHDVMVRGLCAGAHLTALFDCCNSATVMDLPFVYSPHGGVLGMALGTSEAKIRANAARAQQEALTGAEKNPRGMLRGRFKPLNVRKRRRDDAEIVRLADDITRKVAAQIANNGRVVSFSSCADHQKSSDAYNRSGLSATGAMTRAFIDAIDRAHLGSPECTYEWMLDTIRDSVKRQGHVQVPHLSFSHDIALTTMFTL